MGTACFVRGAGDVLGEFEKKIKCKSWTKLQLMENILLKLLRCVGACGLAPVVTVNDKVYGHFTIDNIVR